MQNKQPPILIVDDNPENIAVLFDFLTKYSLEILVAQDGESALQIARCERPSLILLDVLMSGIDGFETCQRFKADIRVWDIPIIFITALADTVSKVRGFEVGGVDYITKPFELEEVLARVKTHLMIYHLQRELRAKEEELEKANQQLQALVTIDELTQIANRRFFNERFSYEWHRLKRERLPLSLIMCDVDHFKRYNDKYGHLRGDECLKKVAQALKLAVKRSSDLVVRYGGEEFAVILPNTPLDGAIHVANNIQQQIKLLAIVHDSVNSYITISLGVSAVVPHPHFSPEALVEMADHALYEAKKRGRNCVVSKPL